MAGASRGRTAAWITFAEAAGAYATNATDSMAMAWLTEALMVLVLLSRGDLAALRGERYCFLARWESRADGEAMRGLERGYMDCIEELIGTIRRRMTEDLGAFRGTIDVGDHVLW